MGTYGGVELRDLSLSSPRLTLRPWRSEDAEPVYRAMQDRRMHEFLTLPDPYTRADAEAFVSGLGDEGRAEGAGLGCALVEQATGRLVGSGALRLPRPRDVSAEIGYAVYPGAQGNGYAAEASRTLAEWGFAHGINRVEIRCAVANLPSAKSALNAGFGFEAAMRAELLTPAGAVDSAVFARLAHDPGRPIDPVFPALPPAGLDDGVLSLRVLSPRDVDAVLDEAQDPLVRRWAFTDVTPAPADIRSSAAAAGLRWLVGPVARFAVVEMASGQTAGSLQIRLPGPPQVGGVGYALRPAFRGRGYATRALRLVASWCFAAAGFARLELGAKADNVASQKAALAAGFLPDGVRTARLRNPDGTFSDEVRFALVNPAVRPPAG